MTWRRLRKSTSRLFGKKRRQMPRRKRRKKKSKRKHCKQLKFKPNSFKSRDFKLAPSKIQLPLSSSSR